MTADEIAAACIARVRNLTARNRERQKTNRAAIRVSRAPRVTARQKREADPDLLKAWRADRRASYVKSKYGLSAAEYHAMRERQHFCCITCNTPETASKRRLHVDHDHATGKVRGLLCHHCNSLIGLARDDASVLRLCAVYLEYHSQKGES